MVRVRSATLPEPSDEYYQADKAKGASQAAYPSFRDTVEEIVFADDPKGATNQNRANPQVN